MGCGRSFVSFCLCVENGLTRAPLDWSGSSLHPPLLALSACSLGDQTYCFFPLQGTRCILSFLQLNLLCPDCIFSKMLPFVKLRKCVARLQRVFVPPLSPRQHSWVNKFTDLQSLRCMKGLWFMMFMNCRKSGLLIVIPMAG